MCTGVLELTMQATFNQKLPSLESFGPIIHLFDKLIIIILHELTPSKLEIAFLNTALIWSV